MADTGWEDEIARRVPLAQMVVGALVIGSLAAMAVAVVVWRQRMPAARDELPLVTYSALACAASLIVVRLVVPAAVMTRGRENIVQGTWEPPGAQRAHPGLAHFLERTGNAGKLWLLYLARTIVCAAVLEAAAFVCLAAFFVDGSGVSLAVAAALTVGIALHFPTRRGVLAWIGDQLRMIDERRPLDR